MSVDTLRPNGTVSNEGDVTGAASAHDALSDDSDGSYVDLEIGEGCRVVLGDYSPVSESVVKTVRVRVRRSKSAAVDNIQLSTVLEPPSGSGYSTVVLVGSTTPTTVQAVDTLEALSETALDGATVLVGCGGSVGGLHVHEVYVDVTYVEEPDLTVDAPTGTVTDATQPDVEWTPDLDGDGGPQTHYEVKVFDDATYGGGGFDPDTSTPTTESGEVASSASSYQVEDALPEDTYRAYVRIAQTVNGEKHWSAWHNTEFTINVDRPGDPTLALTPQAASGRIQLDLDDNAGDATTDAFEVQFSHDGGSTWVAVRTEEGEGVITGNDETIWDYEAPNGETVTYRARALHDYSGLWAASAWVQDSDSWSSQDRWLKHPTDPNLNTKVEVHSYASHQRSARQTVHQPLGRTDPVVVTDTRGPKRGEITLWLDDEVDREALGDLLETLAPLLLQMADGDERPDRWVVFGDAGSQSAVDKLAVADTLDTLTWTEVARP